MRTIIYLLTVLFIVGCNFESSEYKALKAQNDSLLRAERGMQQEIDGYLSAMNQIGENIEQIKITQGIITSESENEELDKDQRAKINEDLIYLNEMLRANKDELARLKTKIKKSAVKSDELEKTITRLTKALEEETSKVELLTRQLAEKDSLIASLGENVSRLGRDIEGLRTDIQSKDSKIKEQDESLNTAWYVYGTRKELKEQSIINTSGIFSSKVLQGDFNKSYFVRIDLRQTKTIPLYSSKAKVLTNHPKSSYTLEKENDKMVLHINNPTEFWKVSKYLVIEVD